MIKTHFIGTLGKDSEIRDAGNTKVINFSVAVNTGYGDNIKTLWIECAKFGEKTNVSEFLKKGTKVYIDGEPSLREWESKDGKKGTSFQCRVDRIELVGGKRDENSNNGSNNYQAPQASENGPNDDLPF